MKLSPWRKRSISATESDTKVEPQGTKITTYSFKPFSFEKISAEPYLPTWPPRPPGPMPRSGHRIVCDDGNFYSFGGYLETNHSVPPAPPLIHGTQRLFEELWCFNYAQKQWKQMHTKGTAPKELASHSAVLHGNFLVVFGGTGVPFGGSSSNRMNICDLSTLKWKSVHTCGDPPTPQYGQAVVLDNKSFYVIGGTTGYDYSMDIHKLDLNTYHWETLYLSRGDVAEPPPRYRHEVAFNGTHIYILGGGTATLAYDLAFIPAFNVETREWSTVQTYADTVGAERFPRPRKCQGSVQKADDVFICGGYDSKNIFMDLWKLNLKRMQWTYIPVKLPIPVYFHSTSITPDGCMYMFGGVTHIKNNTRTNQVFKIWLGVASLKEICWEALLHYDTTIKQQSHKSLLEKGIPKEFVERVYPAPPCGHRTNVNQQWKEWKGKKDITNDAT